jgi:hypothetical protein
LGSESESSIPEAIKEKENIISHANMDQELEKNEEEKNDQESSPKKSSKEKKKRKRNIDESAAAAKFSAVTQESQDAKCLVCKPEWVKHDGDSSLYTIDIHPSGKIFATAGSGKHKYLIYSL